MSIIHKHIPRQSYIDKIVRNIETCIIHSLELPIQAQDLVKAYQHSTHFCDIYQYITDGKLPSGTKAQNCIRAEALNYVVINHFLFRIDTRKDKDIDKGNSFLLVIPEKYEPIIFNTYHDSLLAGDQGPYHTAMTIRQKFFIHNLMNKVKRYCYIVGLGLDCKFIDLLIKRSINIFIKISLYLNFVVLEIISKQTDTLI